MHDHKDFGPDITVAEFHNKMAVSHSSMSAGHKKLMGVSGLLFLLGIIAIVIRATTDGFEYRAPWGYYAATVAFLLTAGAGAPLMIARISELYAAVGVLTLALFIPLLLLVPNANNRFTLWFQADNGGSSIRIPWAPHFWITLIIAMLVVSGIALLLVSARSDKANLNDKLGKPRGWLSKGWAGNSKQWSIKKGGLTFLGACYFFLLVGALSFFSVDFGWKDAIFPAFQSVTGLQAGLAAVIVTLWLVRRYCGFEEYIQMEHFWAASKILLALSLMFFYFWWSGFIIYWYGKMPAEVNVLDLLMFGPYKVLFFSAFILNFLAPFIILLWNSVRKTMW